MTTGNNHSISFTPLSDKVRILFEEVPELELPLHLEEEVEAVWQREKAKHNLYDSFLFSLDSYNETRLIGHFVKYRYYIASRHLPEIQEYMNIHPLGVSGLCICKNKVLVGIRDSKLSRFGGFYECVPSGSVEARAYMHGEVDFVAQAMWELSEEAHISEKQVREVHHLGLYFCPKEGVYDIGLLIRLDLLDHEMLGDGTAEYPLLKWCDFKEFEQKLRSPEVKMVPLSKALWQTYSEEVPES